MASVEELCDHIALINDSQKILDGEVKEVKSRFKTNTFEINYSGYNQNIKQLFNGQFELVDVTESKENSVAKIKINDGSQNDLLKHLLPHIQIHSFNEIIPSMNDIFIQRVAEANQSKN